MKKNQGTTLIEILVATLVFTVALGALLSAITASLYLVDLSREQAIAVSDLRNIMERIRATAFNNIVVQFPDADVDGPAGNSYSSIVGGYRLNNQSMTVTYPDVNSDPLEIRVRLAWQDKRGRAQSVAASTFRTR